jgi:hypothetical protein
MSNNEKFIVRDCKTLTLESGKDITWLSGELSNISTRYALKSPNVFKVLFFDEVDNSHVGKEFPLETDTYDYLNGVLPHDSDGWMLLGSNCNSAIILYGEKEEILKAETMVEGVLFEKVGGMAEVDFDMGGFSYFIWHLENGKSFMIIHNDEMYVLPLRDMLMSLNLILVGSGGHADDVLATEFLTAALMKQLKKEKIDNELSEDFIEYYGEDLEYDDYVLIKGKTIKKKDKDVVLELAHLICCDLLKQHEIKLEDAAEDEIDTIEAAKRIKKLYDDSQLIAV